MACDNYEIRKAGINKWFDEYITSTFVSTKQFGHLECNHLNKSDSFLMKRCTKTGKDCSTFIGDESRILEVLIKIIIKNREELIDYLADVYDIDPWEISGDLPDYIKTKKYCSSASHDWNAGPAPCTNIIIAFKKNPYNKNSLVITSAYPS